MPDMIVRFEAATSIGSRDKNQDAFMVDTYISSIDTKYSQEYSGDAHPEEKLFVCAVCDGIGMFEHSGKAAERALEGVRACADQFRPSESGAVDDALREWVRKTIAVTNDAVIELNSTFGAGGCTIVLLAVYKGCYVLANLGDSPAFLLENDVLSELSTRHTMANLKRLLGQKPTEDENHLLLHYLGEKNAQISLTYSEKNGRILPGFSFFLCSDGVLEELGEEGLKNCLSSSASVQEIIKQAAESPSADNCTAIAVRCFTGNEQPSEEETAEDDPPAEDKKQKEE